MQSFTVFSEKLVKIIILLIKRSYVIGDINKKNLTTGP